MGRYNSGVEQPHKSAENHKETNGTRARILKANGRELVGA